MLHQTIPFSPSQGISHEQCLSKIQPLIAQKREINKLHSFFTMKAGKKKTISIKYFRSFHSFVSRIIQTEESLKILLLEMNYFWHEKKKTENHNKKHFF